MVLKYAMDTFSWHSTWLSTGVILPLPYLFKSMYVKFNWQSFTVVTEYK